MIYTYDANKNVSFPATIISKGIEAQGDIFYKGTNATSRIIKFLDNTSDAYGNGISIGGGGIVIIGAGESSDLAYSSAGDESLYLAADSAIHFYANAQNGLTTAVHMALDTSGNLLVPKAVSENGVLLENKYLGKSATAADSDKVDGFHASGLTKFYLSPMTSGAPADSAKS